MTDPQLKPYINKREISKDFLNKIIRTFGKRMHPYNLIFVKKKKKKLFQFFQKFAIIG